PGSLALRVHHTMLALYNSSECNNLEFDNVVVAEAAGVATATSPSISTLGPGAHNVVAVYSDAAFKGSSGSIVQTVNPLPVSASMSTVTAAPVGVPADGATASTITITLRDALGAAVAGKTVTLAADAGSSTISAA